MQTNESPRLSPGVPNNHTSIKSATFDEVKTAARGRWRDILTAHGVDESRLKNKHGPCPVCGGKDRFRFDDKDGDGTFYSNSCGSGDGFKLLSLCLNRSPSECKNLVAQFLNISPAPVVSSKKKGSTVKQRRDYLNRLCKDASRISDQDQAYRYLTVTRGLKAIESEALAFHPAVTYRDDKGQDHGERPCLLARVQDPTGQTVTIHRTYLTSDGRKILFGEPKKLLSPVEPLAGSAIRLFAPVDGLLGLAEGIETALFCAQETGIPVWSTISAPLMKSVVIPDDVHTVVIYADNDSTKTSAGQKAATALAERLISEGKKVKILTPRTPGNDWLDEGSIPDVATIAFFEPPVKSDSDQHGTGLERIWLEEKPLQRELPPPEEYPLDALCSLEPVARKLSQVIQAALPICAFSLLAAVNLAVQPYADIVVDGRISPISCFFISIAGSGERKSAVDTEALRAHREWQERRLQAYNSDYARWEDEVAVYKSEKTRILAGRKTASAKKKEEIAALEAPLEPLKPILLVSEPTFEGLCKQLISGLPYCGLFSDEGGRFLGGHAMSDDHKLKTTAGVSGLWDRGEVDRMRSGDGTTIGYGKRLALHLMVQPEVSARLLADRSLKDQGFLSRCLVVRPESRRKTYVETDLSRDPVMLDYWRNIRAILEHPLPLREGQRNSLAPRRLVLSPEAKAEYIRFHDQIQGDVCAGGRLEPIKGFASKAHDHAARLAATLALYEDLGCSEVRAIHYHSGVQIVLHCISELLRLIDAEMSEPLLLDAEALLDWLKKRGQRFVSLAEIYKYGPNSVRNAKRARQLMETLYEHGHVRPCMNQVEFEGTVRRECYEIRTFAGID